MEYYLKDKKEKPFFTYAVSENATFEKGYYLFSVEELDEAFIKLKECYNKNICAVLYEVYFENPNQEYKFCEQFEICESKKIVYNDCLNRKLHCKFYLGRGKWINVREDWKIGQNGNEIVFAKTPKN